MKKKHSFFIVMSIFWILLVSIYCVHIAGIDVSIIKTLNLSLFKSLFSELYFDINLFIKEDYIFASLLILSAFFAGMNLLAGIIFDIFKSKMNMIVFSIILLFGLISESFLSKSENILNIFSLNLVFFEKNNLNLSKDFIIYMIFLLPLSFVYSFFIINVKKEIKEVEDEDYIFLLLYPPFLIIISIIMAIVISFSISPFLTIVRNYGGLINYHYLIGMIIILTLCYFLGFYLKKLFLYLYKKIEKQIEILKFFKKINMKK